MRIVILGNAGSGKSTLAKSLARVLRMPMLDLDTIVWEPEQIAVQRDDDIVLADLAQFCRESDQWVIEGCYGDLIHAALPNAPLLIFLDPGRDACLANCRARPWEPHKYRSKAEQDAHLEPLLDWVSAYYQREGPMSLVSHRAVFDAYRGAKRRVAHLDELEDLAFAGLTGLTGLDGVKPAAAARPRPPTRPRSLAR
jgi:adenylate kinase family enzyme